MCGIVGYAGESKSHPLVILNGLRRLEYRGYDSAGIAFGHYTDIQVTKATGSVNDLSQKICDEHVGVLASIGHTRWATHGGVSHKNAHPHVGNLVAIVHNGIIDNADHLRSDLEKREGRTFVSETDTEVIAQLIDVYYSNLIFESPVDSQGIDDVVETVTAALKEVHGTYGLAILFRHHPGLIVVAKNGSPLVIGVSNEGNFVASDASALVEWTNQIIYLEDGDIAAITRGSIKMNNDRDVNEVDIIDHIEQKGNFKHYMLKEIWEQPDSIQRCFGGRIRDDHCILGGFGIKPSSLTGTTSVTILGCGTSYHAGLVVRNLIQKHCNIRCNVELASEFTSNKIVVDKHSIYLAISQSGETFDTIECIKELHRKGCSVYGIVNVVGSTIARLCGRGMYVHAGPEISVASTKAFTSQVAALLMFTSMLGRTKTMGIAVGRDYCKGLKTIPEMLRNFIVDADTSAYFVAEAIKDAPYVLFLGRGVNYPVAMEGALKLKEIAYIPCDAYAGGEMKHGPIAMIEKGTPVICINPLDDNHQKMLNNIEEIKARGAYVIVIQSHDDFKSSKASDMFIQIPHGQDAEHLSPFFSILILQLIAYHTAVLKGNSVDKPRNLAKSVTVS